MESVNRADPNPRDIAAKQVKDIISNYTPERFEELTNAINSDDYNKHLLAECKDKAIKLIETGNYEHVIYGIMRHGVELKYIVPVVIPMTERQFKDSELKNAHILAVHM